MQFLYGEWWYKDTSGSYYTNRADGLWDLAGPVTPEFTHMVKYPANIGDVFPTDTVPTPPSGPYIVEKYTVIAKDITVTVPAGTFKVIRYRLDAFNLDGTLYEKDLRFVDWAPGIGMVRAEEPSYQVLRYKYSFATSELVEVDLK